VTDAVGGAPPRSAERSGRRGTWLPDPAADTGGLIVAVADLPPMPSDSPALLRSIRRWLLVTVTLFGIGLVVLADTGYILSGYQDGPLFAVAGVTGGVVAVVAGLKTLGSLLAPADHERSTE
jgi:hypothetical protein